MIVFNTFTHDARVQKEAKTLVTAGHQVLVLAVSGRGLPRQEVVDGVEVQRVSLSSRRWFRSTLTQGIKYLEYSGRTLRAALAWRADVYHAHNANTLLIAYLAARLRRARLVYDAHELETGRNWGSSNVPPPLRRLWALPERLVIGRADAVMTVCDSIADELARLYRIPRPFVVRNVPEYQGRPVANALRQPLGMAQDIPLIMYQGTVTANRGLEQVIEAMAQLERGALVILGDGPLLEPLRQQVEERGLAGRVFLPGRVPLAELPGYTAAADVGLALIQNACLSYYYCLPNKLFEYIQAGVPVLASNFPEMARVVQTHEVGEVVDPADRAAIATALNHLLNDPAYYGRLRQNALTAASHFTWTQEGEGLLGIYQDLARLYAGSG
ncbi:MAG: glycosyltransferase family 4 protein [Chloroflexota bacterium]